MTRLPKIAVLVLSVLVAAAPMAAAAPSAGTAVFDQETETPTPTPGADGNVSVTPGEKLSGVVGVQQAELEGEVAERTYGVKIARANSSQAKASVVAEQLDGVEERVDELAQRKETLQEARENGSISDGEYRAKMASVAAELSTARRLANASEETAQGLPADVLASKGINVTAIQTLQNRAQNLSGPEVASIAQSIAGKNVGKSMAGTQSPVDVGKQMPGGAVPPNGTDAGAPDDGSGAPNGTDKGAPNGTNKGAPNGTDAGAP